MKTLCIILARAGSVGLPNKNSLPIAGKPMLQWTIEHAQASASLDRIILSTDGQSLAEIATNSGIETILRPDDLASSTATVDAAARHALQTLEEKEQTQYDQIVILYGNVPVRPPDLTDRALAMLVETSCDSVQSVYPVEKNHPFWMKRVDEDNHLLMYQENNVYRRQDLPPVYMLDGGIIAVTRKSLFTQIDGQPHAFLGSDRRAVITQPHDVVDIDSALDLKVAEAVLMEKLLTVE